MKGFLYLLVLLTLVSCAKIELTGNEVVDLTPINARIKSEFLIETKSEIISQGLYLSKTDETPKFGNHLTLFSDSVKGNLFYTSIPDLKPGKTYYVRSFINTEKKLVYSDPITITTTTGEKAKLDTISALQVSHSAVVVQSKVLVKGVKTDVEAGFCLAAHYEPDTSDTKVSFVNPTDTFRGTFAWLTTGGTYFIRPYAINSVGISYGDQIEITTYERSKRPKRTPSRENINESMQAQFYLGASEENTATGFRKCVLNGYAYDLVPGDIQQELNLRKYAEINPRIDLIYPENTSIQATEGWKTFERIIDKGVNGMKFSSIVRLYFQYDILKKIIISIPETGTEKEHNELVRILSEELTRNYSSAEMTQSSSGGITFKNEIRSSSFENVNVRIVLQEQLAKNDPTGLTVEYCIDCD